MKRIAILAAIALVALVAFAGGVLLSTLKATPEPVAAGPASPKPSPGAAPVAAQNPPPAAPVASSPGALGGVELARAERLYRTNCASCHLGNGKGEEHHRKDGIPDFTDASWHAAHPDAELVSSVESGVGAIMPAFKKRLAPDEIALVVRYLRGFPARGGSGDHASNASGAHEHGAHGDHAH